MNRMLWKLNPVFRLLALVLGVLIIGIQLSSVPLQGADYWIGWAAACVLTTLAAWNLWQFGLRRIPLESRPNQPL